MEILTPLTTAVASGIIVLIIITILKKVIGFEIKLWLVPLNFLIGFISRPFLIDLVKNDENEFFVGEKYENETIILNGKDFSNCQFINCKLVINGLEKYSLVSCTFTDQTYLFFDGAAGQTLGDLTNIYNSGNPKFSEYAISAIQKIISPDNLIIINHEKDTLSFPPRTERVQKIK